jgi:hypothetical protein
LFFLIFPLFFLLSRSMHSIAIRHKSEKISNLLAV